MFAASLSVLLFYTAIAERSMIKTYPTPLMKDYEQLLQLYSESVSCPCTHISIPYNEFVTELYVKSFHAACNDEIANISLTTSEYLRRNFHFNGGRTDRCLTVYFAGTTRKKRSITDENYNIALFINALYGAVKQVCSSAKQSVNSSINLFMTSPMFVRDMMSSDQFYNEMNTTIIQFQQRIPIEFIRTLNLIRTTTEGNALMTVLSANWQIIRVSEDPDKNASFYNIPVTYVDLERNTSCSCATSRTCTVPAQFYNAYDQSYFTIETIRVGCYFLDAVLHSSFACFYDPKCAFKIFQGMGPTDTPSVNPNTTRFNINDTIETLANEMFIESWATNVFYERFFNSCAPNYCTYKEYYRFDALELLTTFLSVYAGLSFGIRFIVPYLVRMINKIRVRVRVVPIQK